MSRPLSTLPLSQTLPGRPLPPVSRVAFGLAMAVLRWEERRRMRRDLHRLDAHLLRDIGLTEAEARREAAKPFWRG